jgi:putative ABC transport system permease protein
LGKEGTVIGVVKDFHFNSLQQKIPAIVMHILRNNGWYNFLSVRISTKDIPKAVQSLVASWKKALPNHPFDYYFVDEDYDKQYRTEQQIGNLTLLFSILIIFISCLGLLGLVMISVSQRVKEIGVRKVLGASPSGLVALLSSNFLKLVAIAIVIATPVSWWIINKWLQDFVYRVDIGWWAFALAGIGALLIAFITVSFQAVKAAMANPVKSLRTE